LHERYAVATVLGMDTVALWTGLPVEVMSFFV